VISYKHVITVNEQRMFGLLIVELMKCHIPYAKLNSINDIEISKYTLEQALLTLENKNNYLIYHDNNIAGILQVEEKLSHVDGKPIVYIHSLYIVPDYQNAGLGVCIRKFIHKQYNNLRVECECWYNLPAGAMLEKIGFKPMYIHYYYAQSD
jgi:ribosomal protein S18 acetylase RimI-like enzyme